MAREAVDRVMRDHGGVAQSAAPASRSFLRDAFGNGVSMLFYGMMMTGGGLIARYLWGRFIAGDIPPGHFIPTPHAARTAIVDVKNQRTGEVTGQALVSATPVDATASRIDKAVEAVTNVGIAAATGQTPPTHPPTSN